MTLLDVMEARDETPPSREQWLRRVFASEITFTHRRNQFHFVPDRDLQRATPGLIVGRIGRKRTSQENEPPESGLRETERTAWHAALVIIDPTQHGDGQKMAIERDTTVSTSCLSVFTSLAKTLNAIPSPHPYLIEVRAMAEAGSFWQFVEEHQTITTLRFEMVAPNMFGIQDDWDADMRELKATENADKAKFQTESKDGLKVDTPRIRKGVEKVARGTGTVRARAKDGAHYSSDESVKTVTIEKDDDISWSELMKRIARRIFDV
jgi:hypothetical protein